MDNDRKTHASLCPVSSDFFEDMNKKTGPFFLQEISQKAGHENFLNPG